MSDPLAEMPSQPGLILKSAREEMSLSLEQVARDLHLRPAVVRAIEEENYDEFSSDVFLKGYFRTYCRLVNLHEARMMDVLEQQLLVRNKQAAQAEQLAQKRVKIRKQKRILITLAVFCVCLLLIAFAYQVTSQGFSASDNLNESQQTAIVAEVGIEPAGLESENISSAKLADPDASIASSELAEDADVASEFVEESIDQTIAQESEAITDEDLALNSSDQLNTSGQDDTFSEEVKALSAIKALFTGDCWFKVTDITGKNVIADLKKANEEVNFLGSAPFHVVIGDASKVSLFFEDKLINLKPYTSRNGRAEITLKPSVSINQG